jgi:hypothetical protein
VQKKETKNYNGKILKKINKPEVVTRKAKDKGKKTFQPKRIN